MCWSRVSGLLDGDLIECHAGQRPIIVSQCNRDFLVSAVNHYMMSGEEDEFVFSTWVSVLGLAESSVKKLETNLVTDSAVLTQLRDVDIDLLKLGIGDTIRLRSGIVKLKSIQDGIPTLVDEHRNVVIKPVVKPISDSTSKLRGPDGERVYSLAEVEKLLAGKASPGLVAGAGKPDIVTTNSALLSLADLLSKSSSGVDVKDLMRDLLGVDDQPLNSKGEKCLLPVNFLSCVRGTQDSEEIIHSGKGVNLVIQSNLSKKSPEKLTVGQWTAANARILSKLIKSGRLVGPEILDYLEYNRKIGDLLQLYTASSIFQLDHNHRLEVHEDSTRRWNEIDCTLENAHLKRRDDPSHNIAANTMYKPAGSQGASSRRNTSSSGKRGVCWAFN